MRNKANIKQKQDNTNERKIKSKMENIITRKKQFRKFE